MSAVVVPRWCVAVFRGTVHVVVVGTTAHLIFLAVVVLTFRIAVEYRSVVVAVVLSAAVELGLFTLVVVVVEVGVEVTVVAQLFTKIMLPTWPAAVLVIASPAATAVVVVVTLSVIVGG